MFKNTGWLALLLVLSGGASLDASESGGATASISGSVTASDGAPLSRARVTLIELDRSVFTDDAGRYRFDRVPVGDYHVEATTRGLGSAVLEVRVATGENRADLRVDRSRHREQIVVTATRSGRGSAEVVQPVDVLDETALNERMQPTVGETLSQEPGISSTYFGPGASRPVIRGQGAGRVRMLESGLDVGDASTTSPDHAVSTDVMTAQRIEVLRGPATLLYGSTAVGGVVNVIDQRIPERAPGKPFGGTLNLRYGSAADAKAGGLTLSGGKKGFAWHVDALKRDSDDYDIPGRAIVGDPGSPSGTLPNSAVESAGGTMGASWIGAGGFLGGSVRGLDTQYGVPVEEDLVIDLKQRRYDLRGRLETGSSWLDNVDFSVGHTDYEHTELEGGEVGTRFFTENLDGRVELHHGRGIFGAQVTTRDFEALGDEAFVPPSVTVTSALFVLHELTPWESLRFELGARVEDRAVSTSRSMPLLPECRLPRDRDFSGLSGSAGVAWLPGDTYALGVSAAYTTRLPSAEELYSCGEHAATQSVEIGDPGLDEEHSLGIDVSLRKRTGRVTGELTLFLNDYADFIFEEPRPTIVIDPTLPTFTFQALDAEFFGFELSGLVELLHSDDHDLDLEVLADFVDAENSDTGQDLPFIPPMRVGVGLQYRGKSWYGSAHARIVDDQDREVVTAFDTVGVRSTDGYTTIDTIVGYRFVSSGRVHDIMLRGKNLTDEEARSHTSRLRDRVPLPGADVSVVYRLVF